MAAQPACAAALGPAPAATAVWRPDRLHAQLIQKRNYLARPSKPSYGAAGANPERVWCI